MKTLYRMFWIMTLMTFLMAFWQAAHNGGGGLTISVNERPYVFVIGPVAK